MSDRHLTVVPPPRTRSAVSNGRRLFVEADARSPWARRFRDLIGIYTGHIGGRPTAPQQSLIRRIAGLDCELERLEGLLADGKRDEVDIDAYSRWSGQLRRLLEQLGFDETKRDAAPRSLDEYLARGRTAP